MGANISISEADSGPQTREVVIKAVAGNAKAFNFH